VSKSQAITGSRGGGKSKQQNKENFIKESREEAKGSSLVEMEDREKKGIKQKGKLKEKKGNRENILTKQEREIQKKLRTIAKEEKREGKDVKVAYRKIRIEGVQ
jgi:hypothetical protein